jgi:hypothetical protein
VSGSANGLFDQALTWLGLTTPRNQLAIWPADNRVGTETLTPEQSLTNPDVGVRPMVQWGPLTMTPAAYDLAHDAMSNSMGWVGASSSGRMPIYRGQLRGKEPSGNFFSEDRDFAKQFTRQGLDEEVITRHIDPAAIYHPSKPVYAGDEAAVDEAIAAAKREGKSAVRLSEARGKAPGESEPASIFVFDKSGLSRLP